MKGRSTPVRRTITAATTAGVARGLVRNDCIFFGGIPFAEPPVGPLRFAAPAPRRPWSGVLDATRPAKGAPQRAALLPRLIGITCPDQSEDCLHATVWTPTCDPKANLPVVVFIHGGGFEAGSPSNPLIDAGEIVSRGEIVFVSLGYRLGVIGFLPLPDRPNNRGLLDQLAGLHWVRENIRNFGGDPGQVTLVGSSAGANCTAALLASHGKSGLFRRAIAQSGSADSLGTEDEARAMRTEMFVQLERTDVPVRDAAAALERIPIDVLLAAQRRAVDYMDAHGVLVALQLVRDEHTVPAVPLAAIAAGCAPGVDLVAGTTRDELRLWALSPAAPLIEGPEDLARCTRLLLDRSAPGTDADVAAVARAYARAERARLESHGRGEPWIHRAAFYRLATDVCFRLPALRLLEAQSRHARTFSYVFEWATPMFGGMLGAAHAIDIPFLFGSHRSPRMRMLLGGGAELDTLSIGMQRSWAAFAKRADPSRDGFAWPAFDPVRRSTAAIDVAPRILSPAFEDEVSTLSAVFEHMVVRAAPSYPPTKLPSAFRNSVAPP